MCVLGRDDESPAGGGGMGKLMGAAASECVAGRAFMFEKLLKASREENEDEEEEAGEEEG